MKKIITKIKAIPTLLTDTTKVDNSISELQNEMEIISEKAKQLVDDNANKAQSQNNYEKRYDLIQKDMKEPSKR